MPKIRSYPSVGIAATLVALLLPLSAFSLQSSLAPASQPRSGQLGTRHNRTPESRDSSRAGSDEDSRDSRSNHTLREIAALEQKCLDEVNRLRRAHGLSRTTWMRNCSKSRALIAAEWRKRGSSLTKTRRASQFASASNWRESDGEWWGRIWRIPTATIIR